MPEQLAVNEFELLDIDLPAVARVAELPFASDPFDRLLVAQALAGELSVVSRERVFSRYGDVTDMVGGPVRDTCRMPLGCHDGE